MTVTLGALTLSSHLVLEGIEAAPGRAMSMQRTLGGRQVVQIGPPLDGGRVLALQSEGHLTLANVTAVKALEKAGTAVTLTHPRGTFSVIVTGVEVEPDELIVNAESSTTQWWSGTISMIEV